MEGATGLVVEFVGLPGAGKSALSRQVAGVLRARGVHVSEPNRMLDQAGTFRRTLAKAGWGIGGVAAAPLTGGRWVRTFVNMGQRSLVDTGRVILNWFYLIGLSRSLVKRPGVHLLDQGILQGLWSARYAARKGAIDHPHHARAVPRVLPHRIVVVLVQTDPVILLQRLRDRPGGDSRLERDLASGRSAESLTQATVALGFLVELLGRLEREKVAEVMRVEGEQPEKLAATAEAVARWIIAARSRPA